MKRFGPVALLCAGLLLALAGCDGTPVSPERQLDAGALEPALGHVPADGSQASRVSGGGQLREGAYKVSFGGHADASGDAELVVQFHSVSNPAVSGGTFEATGFTEINFFNSDDASCESAMNVTLDGTFNGDAGWSIIYRAGDAGHKKGKGSGDTVRFQLFDGDGPVYDTHAADFPDESSCVGTARTGLDKGNITIK